MANDKPLVYVETSVISYLTAKPSRDLVVAAHQEITREWWEQRSVHFSIVVSQLVINEASAGDPEAARRRLALLDNLDVVEISEEALELANRLIEFGAIPDRVPEDALHVATAAVSEAAYLLTWNCKHLANAAMRGTIEFGCREFGLTPPVLCTPMELMEDPANDS